MGIARLGWPPSNQHITLPPKNCRPRCRFTKLGGHSGRKPSIKRPDDLLPCRFAVFSELLYRHSLRKCWIRTLRLLLTYKLLLTWRCSRSRFALLFFCILNVWSLYVHRAAAATLLAHYGGPPRHLSRSKHRLPGAELGVDPHSTAERYS